jgi:hypothetical protein
MLADWPASSPNALNLVRFCGGFANGPRKTPLHRIGSWSWGVGIHSGADVRARKGAHLAATAKKILARKIDNRPFQRDNSISVPSPPKIAPLSKAIATTVSRRSGCDLSPSATLGHKRTSCDAHAMSALPRIEDMKRQFATCGASVSLSCPYPESGYSLERLKRPPGANCRRRCRGSR